MKKIFLSYILIFLSTCYPERYEYKLSGDWVILNMSYNSKNVYPKDLTPNRISFNVIGYEAVEKIRFDVEDSSIVLPGFNSEELKLRFRFSTKDSIELYLDTLEFNLHKLPLRKDPSYDTILYHLSEVEKKRLEIYRDSISKLNESILKKSGLESGQYYFPLNIYCGKYYFEVDKKTGIIYLSSNKVKMRMISQEYLIEKRVDEIFENL